MALYGGTDFDDGEVALRRPDLARLTPLVQLADLTEHQKSWLASAQHDDATLYFAVARAGRDVGQIVLHDIEHASRVALVGYHIFRRSDRRRGTGTCALRLLCKYSLNVLGLRRLVAITGVENVASQRIAEKSGFERTAAREGPRLIAYVLDRSWGGSIRRRAVGGEAADRGDATA